MSKIDRRWAWYVVGVFLSLGNLAFAIIALLKADLFLFLVGVCVCVFVSIPLVIRAFGK